ncbi:COG1470 family protein [Ancylomarina sp. YFZ004]
MKTNNLFKKIDVKYAIGVILFMIMALCLVNSCSDDKDTIEKELTNSSPKCIDIVDQSVQAGTTTNLDLCAVDVDGDQLKFEFIEKPDFVSIYTTHYNGDTTVVNLSIAPNLDELGIHNVSLEVNDESEKKDNTSFKINVLEKPAIPPVLEEIADVILTAGRTKQITITATDEGGEALVFNIVNNPGFLSFSNTVKDGNTTTSDLVINPQEVADDLINSDITIQVVNKSGVFGSQVFHLSVVEPINVVTIFICGTGMDERIYIENNFDEELIGKLYEELDANIKPDGKKRTSETHNYFKMISEGCGKGQDGCVTNYSMMDPYNGQPRAFWVCHNEAQDFYESIERDNIGDIIVNLVGFSRGAISCMVVNKRLNRTNYKRLKHKNLICIDPVPGVVKIPWITTNGVKEETARINRVQLARSNFTIGGTWDLTRSYVGIYSADERTYAFTPVVPVLQYHCYKETQKWLFTMPGSHETLVGNSQKDGRKCSNIEDNSDIDEFRSVGEIVRDIVVQLLGADLWGNNVFEGGYGDVNEAEFKANCDKIGAMTKENANREFVREKTFASTFLGGMVSPGHEWYDVNVRKHRGKHIDGCTDMREVHKARACYVGPYLYLDYKNKNHDLKVTALEEIVSEFPDNAWEKLQEFKKNAK